MNKITFKDYKKAVQLHYEIAKKGAFSQFLANPSPAQMRELCLRICRETMSKKEEEIFKSFFETKPTDTIIKSIEKVSIDKFRPIISFLKGESDTENGIRVEMAAILIDFEPRPYKVFPNMPEASATDETSSSQVQAVQIETATNVASAKNNPENPAVISSPKKNVKNKFVIGSFAVLSLFGVKQLLFKEKECMRWSGNHYETVHCTAQAQGFASYEIIKPYDDDEYQRKKLDVCDTTTFFKGDKPKVWYSKKNNVVAFFNMDGTNPENGAELRQITPYIIEKYVKPCK
jgi:hypothetical protein